MSDDSATSKREQLLARLRQLILLGRRETTNGHIPHCTARNSEEIMTGESN